MTNRHRTVLYVGVTSDLRHRVAEHRAAIHPASFTKKYNVDRLVYFETTVDMLTAITREKQIKKWSRAKKIRLVESANSGWRDLADDVLVGTSGDGGDSQAS